MTENPLFTDLWNWQSGRQSQMLSVWCRLLAFSAFVCIIPPPSPSLIFISHMPQSCIAFLSQLETRDQRYSPLLLPHWHTPSPSFKMQVPLEVFAFKVAPLHLNCHEQVISEVNLAKEWTAGNTQFTPSGENYLCPTGPVAVAHFWHVWSHTQQSMSKPVKAASPIRGCCCPSFEAVFVLKVAPVSVQCTLFLEWTICSEQQQTPFFPPTALEPLATHGVSNNRHLQEGRWSFSVLLESHQQKGDLMSHYGLWAGLRSPDYRLS